MPAVTTHLPIEDLLPEIEQNLIRHRNLIIEAPPGAGKTTRVPLAVADISRLRGGKVMLLEPRRLAAIRAAEFMAEIQGERVGNRVGYRVRGASKVSRLTQLEVVTEGVFLRMLLDDPTLEGISAVIFDEVHERNLLGDLALALVLESQDTVRSDLHVIAMSATLEVRALRAAFGEAALLTTPGKLYPVETRHVPPDPGERILDLVVRVVRRSLRDDTGDILVFLPGAGEIYRVVEQLRSVVSASVAVYPLLGEQNLPEQRVALSPATGFERKVIVSSAVAETSLTVEGVRVVIDSGLARVPVFDVSRDMTTLDTVVVCRASADQRRGRAGRLAPGVCYRLWSMAQELQLRPFDEPEITSADLTSLALSLAVWGTRDAASLRWLSAPPAQSLSHARNVLQNLGAIDAQYSVTERGRALAQLPVHPRLGAMILRAQEFGLSGLACDVASVLEDPRIGNRRATPGCDLHFSLELLRGKEPVGHGSKGLSRARESAAELCKLVRDTAPRSLSEGDALGLLISFAYPERRARNRGRPGEFIMANGAGALLPEGDSLARKEWLAVASVTGDGASGHIRLAAELTPAVLRHHILPEAQSIEEVRWEQNRQGVVTVRERRLGAIVVDSQQEIRSSSPAQELFLAKLRESAFDALPWSEESLGLLDRIEWLRSQPHAPSGIPKSDRETLRAEVDSWLGPFIIGIVRVADVSAERLLQALIGRLPPGQERLLAELTPPLLQIPTGRKISICYRGQQAPSIEVKLQELFGLKAHPTVCAGRVAITCILLSPAHRPIQITKDLPNFFKTSYAEVRKDLRARYPKHSWPEDPSTAPPERRPRKPSTARM